MTPFASRRGRHVLLLTVLGAALASCSADPADPPASSPPSAPASTSASASPSAAPAVSTASAPVPADGKNLRACRDGTCEVQVSAGTTVPLPKGSGLGPIEVIAVDATTVTLVATLIQESFDMDGGCSPYITGPAPGSPGFVTLSCVAGERAKVNQATLEILGITGGDAVLRVRPAPGS